MTRSGTVLLGILLSTLWLPESLAIPPDDEALVLLQNLDSQDLAAEWEAARQDLSAEAEPSPERLDEIFDRFAASARGWVEKTLLPTWGSAIQEAQIGEAEQALRTARRVGQALAERKLDQLTLDVIERIDEAVGTGNSKMLSALAKGHPAYAEGLRELESGATVAGRETLVDARVSLASSESPFVHWIDYQLALAQYHEDAAAMEAAMTAILERVEDEPYWPLKGWCHWMRGPARFKRGAYEATLQDHEATYELLLQAKDNSAPAALGLHADVYDALGMPAKAWEFRMEAIRELALLGNRPQLHNYLHGAVRAMLNVGRLEDAAAWGNALLTNAEALEWPGRLAEATLLQGQIHTARGQHAEAQALFAASRTHARDLPAGDLRDQLEADVDEALGRLQVETNPQAAVTGLTEALEVRDAAGYTWQRPRMLRDRARAYGNLGDTQQQRKDLETALREVDRRRKEPGEERFRISYWETVQDLVDDMVRFHALTARNPEQAYLYAEDARNRALLDRLRAGLGEDEAEGESQALEQGFPEVEKIRRIQRLLPKGSLLVEAAVLDDHLILWLLDRKNLDMRILEIEATELTERVEELRSQMDRRADVATLQVTAGEMFDLLLGPIRDRLRKAETLIVVPDRTLHRLPWAVLFDRKEKEYLVESHDLTVLPSASILTLGQDREPFGTIEEGPVLVVGDPAFNRDVFDLERLPSAAEEAEGIAGLYGRSTHLSDQEATRSQLLSALGQTRVLHVAGHVQVNERDPLQSSIPLTPETEDDLGLLHAREIYDLPLSNVELVVLSACRSVDGFPSGAREGVAGLARAFLAAGAGAVVASLWDVYDEPSRRLMETFHGHFREGVPPAAALRQAQISLLRSDDPRLRHPASWAGFEALGWAF